MEVERETRARNEVRAHSFTRMMVLDDYYIVKSIKHKRKNDYRGDTEGAEEGTEKSAVGG